MFVAAGEPESVADRARQVPLALGCVDLKGIVLGVGIAAKLRDIRVSEEGPLLVRRFPNISGCCRKRSCVPPPGSGISGDTAHAIFFPRCHSFPADLSHN